LKNKLRNNSSSSKLGLQKRTITINYAPKLGKEKFNLKFDNSLIIFFEKTLALKHFSPRNKQNPSEMNITKSRSNSKSDPKKKKKTWDDKKCNLSKKNSRIRGVVGLPEMLEDEVHHEGNIEAFVVGRDNYAVLVSLRHSVLLFFFLIRVRNDFESSALRHRPRL
jgi:hypothetical protein